MALSHVVRVMLCVSLQNSNWAAGTAGGSDATHNAVGATAGQMVCDSCMEGCEDSPTCLTWNLTFTVVTYEVNNTFGHCNGSEGKM